MTPVLRFTPIMLEEISKWECSKYNTNFFASLSSDRRGEPVLRDDSAVAAQLAVRDRRRHGGRHRGDGQHRPGTKIDTSSISGGIG